MRAFTTEYVLCWSQEFQLGRWNVTPSPYDKLIYFPYFIRLILTSHKSPQHLSFCFVSTFWTLQIFFSTAPKRFNDNRCKQLNLIDFSNSETCVQIVYVIQYKSNNDNKEQCNCTNCVGKQIFAVINSTRKQNKKNQQRFVWIM